MATNKSPWVRNLGGALSALRMLLPVDAGSSYAIKRGEICKVGKNTAGRPGPAASGDTSSLVIADQEQKAADVARFLPFIIPRPDDLFEFAATAARAFVPGDPLAIGANSQTLTYTVAGTNAVARIADDSNAPEPEEKSVTRRSLANAYCVFDEQASYYSQLTGNS